MLRFDVRWPDGHLEHVSLGNSLVILSVTVAFIVTVWSWTSAHCECLREQQASHQRAATNEVNRNLPSPNLVRQPQTENPQQEPNQGGCASPLGTFTMSAMDVFTGVLVVVGYLTYRVYRDMRDHNKEISRAYVTMSHLSPGISIDPVAVDDNSGEPTQEISLSVKVQNFGNTPARVVDMVMVYIVDRELPATPPIPPRGGLHSAFLVKGDSFVAERSFDVSEREIQRVRKGDAMLWILGAITYIDVFNVRHRTNYARFYNVSADDRTRYSKRDPRVGDSHVLSGARVHDPDAYERRNNMHFVTQVGYNDDVEIDENDQPKKRWS